jgi:hypothetical protein
MELEQHNSAVENHEEFTTDDNDDVKRNLITGLLKYFMNKTNEATDIVTENNRNFEHIKKVNRDVCDMISCYKCIRREKTLLARSLNHAFFKKKADHYSQNGLHLGPSSTT